MTLGERQQAPRVDADYPFSEVQSKQHYLMVMEVRTRLSSGVEATGQATGGGFQGLQMLHTVREG